MLSWYCSFKFNSIYDRLHNLKYVASIFLNAVSLSSHKVGHLTRVIHYVTIDYSHFFFLVASFISSNIRGSWGCSLRNVRYPHKRTTRVLNAADLGGHRISQKRKTTFPEKICVVRNMLNRLLIPLLQAQLAPI